jgi:hypothetical protein
MEIDALSKTITELGLIVVDFDAAACRWQLSDLDLASARRLAEEADDRAATTPVLPDSHCETTIGRCIAAVVRDRDVLFGGRATATASRVKELAISELHADLARLAHVKARNLETHRSLRQLRDRVERSVGWDAFEQELHRAQRIEADVRRRCEEAYEAEAAQRRRVKARRAGSPPTAAQVAFDSWRKVGFSIELTSTLGGAVSGLDAVSARLRDVEASLDQVLLFVAQIDAALQRLAAFDLRLTRESAVIRNHVESLDYLVESRLSAMARQAVDEEIEAPFVLARSIFVDCNGPSPELHEIDQRLVSIWRREFGGSASVRERLELARAAEKFMLDRFASLFDGAIDVSIGQLSGASDDWTNCDIDVSEYGPVDVKHARYQFGRGAWSHLLVKRAKRNNANQCVRIAGVMTMVDGSGTAGSGSSPMLWIGDGNAYEIPGLARVVATSIEYRPGADGRLFPPWAFEYPSRLYEKRRKVLRDVEARLKRWGVHRIPASLGVLLDGPFDVSGSPEIAAEVDAFRAMARRVGDLTRPAIFLHVYQRLCDSLRGGYAFPASALRQALFHDGDVRIPCALLDPLGCIADAIALCERASAYCDRRQLGRYSKFVMRGPNILQAECTDAVHGGARARTHTLFAYCGECHREPLVIGEDRLCHECGYLKCSQCGYRPGSCEFC